MPKRGLTIRRYAAADREQVWQLHVVALEAVNAQNHEASDEDLDDVDRCYLQGGGEFLVGEINGRIVAMGALKPIDADAAEIKRMRVLPEFQRQGLGQAILGALERRADELGFSSLQLDTTQRQHAARAFYQKNGYAETSRRRTGEYVEIVFVKNLTNRL